MLSHKEKELQKHGKKNTYVNAAHYFGIWSISGLVGPLKLQLCDSIDQNKDKLLLTQYPVEMLD